MNNWRQELNRLAVEFWCGVGDIAEVSPWADIANAEVGEVHPNPGSQADGPVGPPLSFNVRHKPSHSLFVKFQEYIMGIRISSYRWALLALCLGAAPIASALKFYEEELVCPIDGEKFKATLAASGTSFGSFLDLKPFGPIAAPWPLAKCPSSGFVMYKEKFSDAEIAQLREYVLSEKYIELKSSNTNYYLAARLRAHLGEKPSQLTDTLLQSTWEAEHGPQYKQYASEALDAYKQALVEEPANSKRWITNQFIAGELERRLERFEDAKRRFLMLAKREEVKSGILADILELQLQLVEAKDNQPQMIPQKKDAKK